MFEYLHNLINIPLVTRFLIIIGGVIFIFILVRILKRPINKNIEDSNTRYRVRKFIIMGGYLAVILLIVVVFNERLGSMAVGLGVASAGIAFALQEVIVSFAGWLAISVGGFYKIGDRIQLGGTKGDVIDIGILRTTVMEIDEWIGGDQYNGRVVRIANSFIFKEPVFNYSGDFPFLWDEIRIPVKYGSDYKLAREILEKIVAEVMGDYVDFARKSWEEICRKYIVEEANIEPMIMIVANDNWVEFTLRYVVDYRKRRIIRNELFEKLLTELDKTDGKVQIASSTFQVVGLPEVDVLLSERKKK